jgi:deoxycytidylate deaminase
MIAVWMIFSYSQVSGCYISLGQMADEIKEISTKLEYPEAELVFGFVFPVGTDYSGVLLTLENYIKRFNYRPSVIKLSHFISAIQTKVETGVTLDETNETRRIDTYMTVGDRLCELAESESFLVSAAVAEINRSRKRMGGDTVEPLPKTVHILMSLKRPREVELLRSIYGAGFYLIGVFASEHDRLKYLTEDKNIPWRDALRLMKRDQDEDAAFGQRSRDTFQLSDVFIQLKQDEYKEPLERFLDLVFGNPYITPGADEYAMSLAYSASLRSGQLARQVGAAVRTPGGDIASLGCNDVPAPGGGLYWPGPGDSRDHIRGIDSNDAEQTKIAKDLLRRLGVKTELKDALALLQNSRLMDISEYGRAVHAEMDALLTCGRIGVSTVGATLFTTTFPCHNCTRHIIAAGVSRVVYIEPYPKSMASVLHKDAIELTGTREFSRGIEKKRIPFEPFVGIGPRRFYDLFSMKLSSGSRLRRKDSDGRVLHWRRDEARPRVQMLPTSYMQREKVVASRFLAKVEQLEEKQHGIQRLSFEEK